MGFEKGNNFGKGRPKGSVNQLTAELKELLSKYAEGELREIESLKMSLSPKERAKLLIGILPYVLTKEVPVVVNASSEEGVKQVYVIGDQRIEF